MRRRSLYAVIGLLLVLVILTNLQLPFANRVKETLSDGFVPFLELSSRARGGVMLLVHRFKGYTEIQRDNVDLRKRASELSVRVAQMEELERENRQLRKMLEFRERSELRLLSAKVIGRDPSNWWNTILIDRGAADGISRDTPMPVITVDGLVGKTLDVREHDTRVILIVDENCRVSGWMNKSGQHGTVLGNVLAGGADTQCRMTFINRLAEVKPNDLVYTSGLGEFPKGILIGTVVSLRAGDGSNKNPLYREVDVLPAVDLTKLDEVFICIGVKASGETKAPEAKKS